MRPAERLSRNTLLILREVNNADEHFELVKFLGRGAHGKVDCVKSRLSGNHYAVSGTMVAVLWNTADNGLKKKSIIRDDVTRENPQMVELLENEMSALKRLSHRHLIKIIGQVLRRPLGARSH